MGAATNTSADSSPGRIIDIRSDKADIELKQLILDGIRTKNGEPKTLPTLLLYDNAGLKLFEDITYLDEYYLTNEEIRLLQQNANSIAERIPNGAIVLELGSGNLRKIKILLDALDNAGKKITYYALDLMHSELERTLAAVPPDTFKHVECFGLLGTYDDGLDWLKSSENAARPKAVLSMGSSIGNFTREEGADFVAQFASALSPGDFMLLAIDACQDPQKVYEAYNDRAGVTHEFTKNGLEHANALLGYKAFHSEDWQAIGEYDVEGGRHRAFVQPRKDVEIEGVVFKKDERVAIEQSVKYNRAQALQLFRAAGVMEAAVWTNQNASYGMHMLTKSDTMSAYTPEKYAAHPVPSLSEWHDLWSLWDNVTRKMIPDDELLNKPIKLRNACIFYLGHIPTFFDMKLVEATGLRPTEPSYFYNIFERGIDPDVDNPEQCHAHSEIPDTWPELSVILQFQDRVRQRIYEMYKSGQAYNDQWTGRTLWLGFEHEVMHLETLLYMLVQSDKTLPPASVVKPNFEHIAAQAQRDAVPNKWFDIPAQTIDIGLEDPDNRDGPVRYFGWDVEKPRRSVDVPVFQAQARPLTNGEFARYLLATNGEKIPASWVTQDNPSATDGERTNSEDELEAFVRNKAVRTVYGLVPLQQAIDWPISASYDELKGCATYMGGRIPTLEEARSIYEYADRLKREQTPSKVLGKAIPAVNGHLINEGVQETPPAGQETNGFSKHAAGPDPSELHVDLTGDNVGFKHWHPMPVTPNGDKLAGQCGMGGLWEWTSSALEKHENFEPMKLYPAYSADFYDGKHNIVLGGSWATHPRFAGRKSVINWYQRNYPYVWAGARLVRDI